jgi:hypothetical protein
VGFEKVKKETKAPGIKFLALAYSKREKKKQKHSTRTRKRQNRAEKPFAQTRGYSLVTLR